jgi:ArsR family transcriptional regulator, zinc-responsive transcriptional repressor
MNTDKILFTKSIFALLSQPLSVRIIEYLQENGEKNVTSIQEDLEIEQCVASKQLGLMKARKIVKSRRDARKIIYSIDIENFNNYLRIAAELYEA